MVATLGALAACTAAQEAPFTEYPDPPSGEDDAGEAGTDARAARDASDAEAAAMPTGKQVLTGPVFIEGVTEGGNLVFEHGANLQVLVGGSLTPVTVATDYDPGNDALLLRGRFVAAWLGSATAALPLTLWAKNGGVQTVAAKTYATAFWAKPAADEFAYSTPSASPLRHHVWASVAGGGAGTQVVNDLSTGYLDAPCRPKLLWSTTALVVAGCPNAASTASVTIFAADGSGPSKTLLTGSAPGLWLDRARTHALVQTSAASSIRPLAGSAATVALDGPIRQAVFSSNDALVVYLASDGTVKRASTSAPAAPVTLAPSALSLLAVSPDARFTLFATSGDPDKNDSDLVVADATTPGTTRSFNDHAAFIGLSASGTHAVWLEDLGIGLEGTLYVAALPNGVPQKISPLAERVRLEGDVVYWQEFDKPSKSNTLRAARVASAVPVIDVEKNLDSLTTDTVVIGKSLFIANKLGLWGYKAVTP